MVEPQEGKKEDLSAFFQRLGLGGKGLEDLCAAEGIDEPSLFDGYSVEELVGIGFKRAYAKRALAEFK